MCRNYYFTSLFVNCLRIFNIFTWTKVAATACGLPDYDGHPARLFLSSYHLLSLYKRFETSVLCHAPLYEWMIVCNP